MKRAWLLVLAAACGREPEQRPPMVPEAPSTMPPLAEVAIDVSEGLASPEAAIHDPVDDVYLISNLNGAPHALDDNGFITRLSPDGAVLAARWIDGASPDVTLHAPRGMAIHGNTLYVVDADAVRLFDRATGAAKGAWPIPDARFPNDVRVAADGAVFVTETAIHLDGRGAVADGTPTLWRFTPDGTPSVVARGPELAGPNGIVLTPDGPVIASFLGADILRLRDGKPQLRSTLPKGQLDGLVELPDGSLLVTSWQARGIYQVQPDGSSKLVLGDASYAGPASIAYDRARERVIVPLVLANQVRIEPFPVHAARVTSGKSDGTGGSILTRGP